MVSTRQRACPEETVLIQMEGLPRDAAVEVSGCRKCLSLLLPGESSKNSTCVRCEHVNDLLSTVAELKEAVVRPP